MMVMVALALLVAVLGLLAWRAVRIWQDATQLGLAGGAVLGWCLLGSILPSGYWWGARLQLLSTQQRQQLLREETQRLGLNDARALHCPLCRGEVPNAWTLTSSGQITIGDSPIECPSCDFRLDACRHCFHFLPGSNQRWPGQQWSQGTSTEGRCNRYRSLQPIEQLCPPEMALQLKKRGYEQLRGPMRIVDSYLPPDHCRAFLPERRRISASQIQWPGVRRAGLLRLESAERSTSDHVAPSGPAIEETRSESANSVHARNHKWLP